MRCVKKEEKKKRKRREGGGGKRLWYLGMEPNLSCFFHVVESWTRAWDGGMASQAGGGHLDSDPWRADVHTACLYDADDERRHPKVGRSWLWHRPSWCLAACSLQPAGVPGQPCRPRDGIAARTGSPLPEGIPELTVPKPEQRLAVHWRVEAGPVERLTGRNFGVMTS